MVAPKDKKESAHQKKAIIEVRKCIPKKSTSKIKMNPSPTRSKVLDISIQSSREKIPIISRGQPTAPP